MLRSRRCAACFALPLLVMAFATSSSAAVTPAALTTRFATMNGHGWTGGDGTWSARLADGRTVWLFGDTFIGGVRSDGRRNRSTPVVRNSIVVEGRDGTMRTLVGRGAGAPGALVGGATADDWYWPGPPIVGRRTLQVLMAHIIRTGPGPWDVATAGTSLAVFSLSDLRLERLTPVATPPGVNMASAAITAGRFTYVYGTHDDGGAPKSVYVARVAAGELRREWAYWNGRSWTPDAGAATPIAEGFSDQFSVLRAGGEWTAVTQLPMRREVVAYSSKGPAGPWVRRRVVARVPAIAGAITYNATVHPEFSAGRRLMLGFNVNGRVWDAVFADCALYRPRFMEIRVD